ncbi:MAG TPA: hypothetical protein VK617_04315 [Gemmatimonadaceae bacterium]|nr:hypothetical protein [Gemmatimonadaceae bacterium]
MPATFRTRVHAACLGAALVVLASAASCSDKKSDKLSKATADSITAALSKLGDTAGIVHSSGGHKYGAPTGKIRVANLLEIDGKPSGPLDLYDVRDPDSSMTPLISHLEYGTISPYVSPRGGDNFAGSPSNLYLFPANLKKATKPFGGNIDNGGFGPTDQLSLALGPSKGFAGGASVSIFTIVEGGKRQSTKQADTANAIPAGQALLVVRAANTSADSMPEQYLVIDGTCPHAPNDRNVVGDAAHYKTIPSSVSGTFYHPVAPGSHTLGIVTSPRGHGLLTCNGKTPASTTSFTAEAGKRYLAWVFGEPSDGFKVVTAPIATP